MKQKYVTMSLELHLFFARIMKEHSLFLEAAFTPPNADFAQKAEYYKRQFSSLLMQVVKLSNGIVDAKVLKSGEIVTEFTNVAEKQTQYFTGIHINREITKLECELQSGKCCSVEPSLLRDIRNINQWAIKLLNGLIDLKESIITNVLECRMFTMNYPLLIKHILREAKLYRTYVIALESEDGLDCECMKKTEQFWNRIMMEHALFIRGLLDPCESKLIETSDNFSKEYAQLLQKSKERNDMTIRLNTEGSLKETIKFRDFKQTGTAGIQDCKIQSIILPLLADHVLREANHYIRLLES